MADEVKLSAQIRKDFSGRRLNELRRSGSIPGILYGPDTDNLPLYVDAKELRQAISTDRGENALIGLKIGNKKAVMTIIRELQFHPVTMQIIHVDFVQIRMTETVEVEVPIEVVGEAPGIKTDGGVLEHIIRRISVRCLPMDIPESLTVDISGLNVDDYIQVKDIKVVGDIEILDDPELIVMTLSAPTELKEPEETDEVAEPSIVGEEVDGDREEAEAAGEEVSGETEDSKE